MTVRDNMKNHLLLAIIGTFAVIVGAQTQEGFISLDCGLPLDESPYNNSFNGLTFSSDSNFIQTEKIGKVDKDVFKRFAKQYGTMRYFPEGKRNCYSLDVKRGTNYDMVVSFLYGNYDGLNREPSFDLYLGSNKWARVDLGAGQMEQERRSYTKLTQFPLENNVKAIMDKASVTVTTTPRTDTVPPSSSQMQLDTDREVNNKFLAHQPLPIRTRSNLFRSWAKPLFFKPPATPPEPSTPQGYDPAIILNKQLKSKHPTRSLQPPIEKLPPPELKADGSLRFPWAARLSPQSRTLTTSTPAFEPPSFAVSHIVSDSEMNPHFPSSAQTDPQPQQENNTTLPNLSNTLPPLVDSQSAPTQTTIMETSPSNITNNVVLKTPVVDPLTTTPQAGAFESPSRFTVLRPFFKKKKESNSLDICLVKTGETLPVISAIEIRPLGNDIYLTKSGSLALFFRDYYSTSDEQI
ncbi:LOW QUALITY PROTEIN: hypothetical protein HID58_059725, partial [Brassica napus]